MIFDNKHGTSFYNGPIKYDICKSKALMCIARESSRDGTIFVQHWFSWVLSLHCSDCKLNAVEKFTTKCPRFPQFHTEKNKLHTHQLCDKNMKFLYLFFLQIVICIDCSNTRTMATLNYKDLRRCFRILNKSENQARKTTQSKNNTIIRKANKTHGHRRAVWKSLN